ncbi:MAG TPA: tetratricopeptide repeat protein [Terriglobia bacterium]|nr:tetratricopeptide repeat protein [Terriglobia bacterium]
MLFGDMESGEHRQPNTGAQTDWRRWVIPALLAVAAILPYLSTIGFGFVYDDHLAIEENGHLRFWPGVSSVFLTDIWSLSSLGVRSNYYRPLFMLTYEVIFRLAGAAPWAFHLANLVFHAVVVALVYLLTLRLFKKESVALIATLLFALHPAHVEPVAWVAALSELGYTACVLFGVFMYARKPAAPWSTGLSLLSFGVGLLWKESAIAFAPIVVLYDVLVEREVRWRRWSLLCAVTAAYLGLRAFALGGLAPAVLYPDLTFATQVLTALSHVGFYGAKLLAPIGLSAMYSPAFVSRIDPTIVCVLAVAFIAFWKLRGRVAWAAVWIVAGLSPVLLVSRVAVPLADRDLYLPSIGFLWLVALAFDALGKRSAPAVVVVLAIYAGMLLARLPAWRDDVALFEQAIAVNPEDDNARLRLASELGRRGRIDEGAAVLDEILTRHPGHLEASVNKASLKVSAADWPGVRSACASVFRVDPESARCLLNIGYADEQDGRLEEARGNFARAYQRDSSLTDALLHQGIVEARRGNLDVAQHLMEEAVRRNPSAPSLNNLGSVYANRGDMQRAVQTFEMAVQADPSFDPAQSNLELARSLVR